MNRKDPPMPVRRLRALMVLKNIKVADVAVAAGVKRPTVTMVLQGRERSARIMKVLNDMGIPPSLTDEVAKC